MKTYREDLYDEEGQEWLKKYPIESKKVRCKKVAEAIRDVSILLNILPSQLGAGSESHAKIKGGLKIILKGGNIIDFKHGSKFFLLSKQKVFLTTYFHGPSHKT